MATLTAYCDGGCSGNGGVSARGYGSFRIVGDDGTDEIQRFDYGSITNNAAEYRALIDLLEYLEIKNIKGIQVFTDSALLVNQVLGNWKVKAIHLQAYRDKAAQLVKATESRLDWLPRGNIVDKLGH